MEEKAKELLRRSEAAFRRLEFMRALYRDAYRLGCPHREGFSGDYVPGRELQRDVYDSTFQDSVERLANALFVGEVPAWLQWFDYAPGSSVPEDMRDQVQEQLQRPAEIASQRLLNRTNFYTEAHTAFLDFSFGTAAIQMDDTSHMPHARMDAVFTTIPVHELGLEPGPYGAVDTTFRKHKVLGRRFRDEFPRATIPETLQRQMDGRPDDMVDVISCVVPERRGKREFMQYVLWAGGGGRILEEREFFENPVVVPRWSVLSGEVYGRGPALKATANAYSLNEAARLILIAANVAIFGMWTVADDELNPATIKLGPGAMIPVRSNDNGNPSLRELVPSTRLDFGEFVKDDLRGQIQKNLYRDALGSVEGPKMTATEVIERQALVMQDMGAAHGRLTREFLGPVMTRFAGILSRQGKFPPLKVNGEEIAVEYVSPLARAQQIAEINGIRAMIEDATALSALDPTARARLDSGKIIRQLATLRGTSLDAVNDDATVQAIMEQVMMAQQTMAAQGGGGPVEMMA